MPNIVNGISNIFKKLNYILSSAQKKRSIFVFLLMVVGSFLEMLGVSIIIPLVTAMLYPEKLVENPYIVSIMNTFHLKEDFPITILIAIGVIVIYILKNLYLIFLSYIRSRFSCKVQRELSVKLMKTYMKREYTFFLNTNTSELLRSIGEDVARVHNIITYIFRIISELLTLSLICIFIMSADFMMALSAMGVALVCLIVVSLSFRGRMKSMGKERMKYDTRLKQDAYQAFQGIKEIMVMNRSQFFVDKYENGWKKQQKAIINETVASESPAFIIEAVCVAGLITIVCVRIGMGGDATSFLPQLAAFAVGAFRILPAISRITSTLNLMNYYLPGIDSVYSNLKEVEVLREAAEVRDSENQETQFNDKLEINNIYWNYPNSEVEVLSNLCMEIKKGTSVGLVGSSGAGKTTLADVLLGLLRPVKGQILLDGKDICALGSDWSNIIGYVPQSVFLIDDTIRNNIGFGILPENIDDEWVWKTLEQAQLKEFVETLPEGLDTLVGERGVRFSGGQRQRIAIARALYSNPEILVLDEATSALDNETETAVMDSIEALQGYKTLIIVAHRLSTIEKCDVVYEIADGIATKRE